MIRSCFSLTIVMGLALGLAGPAHANLIDNPGFETPDASGGDVTGGPGAPWNGFNVESIRATTAAQSRSGDQSFKVFGPFSSIGGGVGATQVVPITGGIDYTLESYGLNSSSDPMQGDNFALAKVEYLNANQQFVAGPNGEPAGTPLVGYNVFESNQLNADSPQDEWQLLGTGGPAPADAEFANIVLVHVQLGDGTEDPAVVGGSAFFDDVSLTQVPEPTSLALLALGAPLALRRRARQ
jgi:hypothetical protein